MTTENTQHAWSFIEKWVDMDLLKAKLAYFFYLGSLGSIYPIFSIWMKSRGLTKAQTGVLMSTRPLIGFLVMPIAGMLADKLQIHKKLLIGLCLSSVLLRLVMIGEPWMAWVTTFFVLSETAGMPVSALLDAGVVELLGPERRDLYGQQRAWGSLSFGLVAFLIGAVVSAAGDNFNIYFLNHAVMACIGALIFLFLSVTSVKTPAPLWESIGVVFSNVHVGIFFLLITMIGAVQGVLGANLFIMLDEMNASKLTMGMATAVACLAEMPFLFFSGPLLRVLGERNMLYMSCFGGIFRVMWYTYMKNPWLVLVSETMHGPFFGALWTASMSYVHKIAPPGLGATAQGLLTGLYSGIGNGTGAIVGGIVYQRYGYVVLFRGCAVWLFIAFIIFFGTNIFFPPLNLESFGHVVQVTVQHAANVTDDCELAETQISRDLGLEIVPSSDDLDSITTTSTNITSSPPTSERSSSSEI